MDNFFTLPLIEQTQGIQIVCLALLTERIVRISSSIDPLAFFRFVCHRMARQVSDQQYSKQQLLISGTLSVLILILPILIIVYLVIQFASYQWLLDIFILWVIIQYTDDKRIVQKGIDALQTDKKQLAKDLLQQKLLRNTQPLSSLGLCKAGVESLFLRYHHQQFTTILCYLILGPIAAICYRFCYEANQVWNVKLKEFRHFGRFTNAITQTFQFVPSLVMSISFVLICSPNTLLLHLRKKEFHATVIQIFRSGNNQSLLLQTLSSALHLNVGGPVMYGQTKVQRARFTGFRNEQTHISAVHTSNEPTNDSVKTLINLVNRHLIVSLIIIAWIMFWSFES